jgi:hypothetical protein
MEVMVEVQARSGHRVVEVVQAAQAVLLQAKLTVHQAAALDITVLSLVAQFIMLAVVVVVCKIVHQAQAEQAVVDMAV